MQNGREKKKTVTDTTERRGRRLKGPLVQEAAGSYVFLFFPTFGSNLYLAYGRNMTCLVATHKAIGV